MLALTRDLVHQRADGRCEYCRLHQKFSDLSHHIEHVIAKQHGGLDNVDNLAFACHYCNLHKGPNLSGIDPVTGAVVPLFHPRRDSWTDHFLSDRTRIESATPVGRATIIVLAMNEGRRLDLRAAILDSGESPVSDG
jgi:5-methylcytosine-specific restriction endonuclease McrA